MAGKDKKLIKSFTAAQSLRFVFNFISARAARREIARHGVPVAGLAIITLSGLPLIGCGSPQQAALQTNVPLTSAPDLGATVTTGARIWRSPDLAEHERRASAYLISPATVYRGRGATFSDLKPAEVDQIASELTRDVRTAIGRRFRVVDKPGPGVFRLELTLLNIVPPRQQYVGSGPFAISDLAVGNPNAGGESPGMVTIVGKFFDAETDKLLVAFSEPVSPDVIDLPEPGMPSRARDFANAAVEQFADNLVQAIVRQRQNVGALPKQ